MGSTISLEETEGKKSFLISGEKKSISSIFVDIHRWLYIRVKSSTNSIVC